MKGLARMFCTIGLCAVPTGAVVAQEDGESLGRVYYVTAKQGHGAQLEAGAKAYFECYGENGGEKTWRAWQAETGKLGRYAFTIDGQDWASFDERESAGRACSDVFNEQYLPHVAKATSSFTRLLPAHSRYEEKEYGVAWKIDFKVNDDRTFLGAVRQITAAANEADWGNYAWYDVVAGGHYAGDYFIVVLEENFAGFGEESDTLWQMVAKVHGEETAEEIRGNLRDVIQNDWANIWRRRPDLGYSPEG